MADNIICPNCKTAIRLDDPPPGQAILCPNCKTSIPISSTGSLGPISLNPRLERVMGRPTPLFFDIVGLHVRWSANTPNRDIFRFVWSLRHIVLFMLALSLFFYCSDDKELIQTAPVGFFVLGVIFFFAAWMQMTLISHSLATNITGQRSPTLLSSILSGLLVITTDFRAALPALRTFVLACFLLFAAIDLAADSGNLRNLLHLPSFSTSQGPAHPYKPPVAPEPSTSPAPTATAPAPAPSLPHPEELPLPPPDDSDSTPPAK